MDYSLSPHIETERYRAILQAAERLFLEKGYHTVSIEQIADVAGVSKGLVHYHFINKEKLLVCILKDMLAKLSTRLDDIAESNETAQSKIRLAIKSYLDLASSRLELARIMIFEDVLTEETKNNLVILMEENMLKLAGLVEAGTSKGEFKPVNSRLVANLMTGAIIEVVREAAIQQRELQSEELAAEIVEVLCGGINR
ncbi:TetR/AcrR family transcriptional regulator [Chloroflexota bacterium]